MVFKGSIKDKITLWLTSFTSSDKTLCPHPLCWWLNVLQMVGTEFEIDSDLKTLQFYSIEDGDQVLVRWSWPEQGGEEPVRSTAETERKPPGLNVIYFCYRPGYRLRTLSVAVPVGEDPQTRTERWIYFGSCSYNHARTGSVHTSKQITIQDNAWQSVRLNFLCINPIYTQHSCTNKSKDLRNNDKPTCRTLPVNPLHWFQFTQLNLTVWGAGFR